MSDTSLTPPPLPKQSSDNSPPPLPQKETIMEEAVMAEEKSSKTWLWITLAVLLFFLLAMLATYFAFHRFSSIVNKNQSTQEESNNPISSLTFNQETQAASEIAASEVIASEPQAENQPQTSDTPFTTTVLLNLRLCPATTCDKLGLIPKNSKVYPILNKDGNMDYRAEVDKTTGWIHFLYKGPLCLPENFNQDSKQCSHWEQNQTVQGWLHSTGVISDINLQALQVQSDAQPLGTFRDTDIRQCASTSCEVVGVIPKETAMSALLMDRETPAVWNNWLAIEYQGDFCYPNHFNQNSGCLKWTKNQKVRGFVHRSTVNFHFNPEAIKTSDEPQPPQLEDFNPENEVNNLF